MLQGSTPDWEVCCSLNVAGKNVVGFEDFKQHISCTQNYHRRATTRFIKRGFSLWGCRDSELDVGVWRNKYFLSGELLVSLISLACSQPYFTWHIRVGAWRPVVIANLCLHSLTPTSEEPPTKLQRSTTQLIKFNSLSFLLIYNKLVLLFTRPSPILKLYCCYDCLMALLTFHRVWTLSTYFPPELGKWHKM